MAAKDMGIAREINRPGAAKIKNVKADPGFHLGMKMHTESVAVIYLYSTQGACTYVHRRAERWIALNYASHYPFSRRKARSQQQAPSNTTKIKNQVRFCCCATTKRRALVSGHDSLGQPCFHGQERRGVSVACSFQMSGSIVSTGSLQQRFVAKISHKRTLWPCTSGPYR